MADTIEAAKGIAKNWLTSRDNQTWSLTKLFAITAVSVMSYGFVKSHSVDFTGYGMAVGGVIAAMAMKYHVEDKPKGDNDAQQ